MFDLQSDPNEMQSVYGSEQMASVQAKLMADLTRLRDELDVPEEDPPASLGGGKDNPTSVNIRKSKD